MTDPGTSLAKRRPDEPVEAWVARVAPLLAHAAEEVDRSLIAEALSLSPLDRLRACTNATRGLESFRRDPTRHG